MGLIDYLKKKLSKKPDIKSQDNKEQPQIEKEDVLSDKPKESCSPAVKNIKEEQKEKEVAKKAEEEKRQQANKDAYIRGMKKANHGFMFRLKSLTSAFHK